MEPLFLALKAHINDYEKIQDDFNDIIKGRWAPPSNLHMTINYFGNQYSLDELLRNIPPFLKPVESFKLCGLGYFESNKILYANSEVHTLDVISSSIADALSLKQKPFVAHVTLMRVKEIKDKDAFKKALENYKDIELGSTETTFELMQSHIRHPGGAIYESIKKF